MNAKWKLVSILTIVCLILGNMFFLETAGVKPVSAASVAQYGGFLYPWTGSKTLTANTHDGLAIDIADGTNFDILAPKDGVVLYYDDNASDNWTGNCSQIEPATNYIVLGHGYKSPNSYSHYSVYYHLKAGSIPSNLKEANHFVKLGEKIGQAGRTGRVAGVTGIHLHFLGTDKPVHVQTNQVRDCNGNLLASSRTWITVSASDTRSVGFEEAENLWPLLNGGTGVLNNPSSYNWTGIQQENCNPFSTNVALYNHIDYGGECMNVSNPENGYNVPSGRHVSSVYLNPSWVEADPLSITKH